MVPEIKTSALDYMFVASQSLRGDQVFVVLSRPERFPGRHNLESQSLRGDQVFVVVKGSKVVGEGDDSPNPAELLGS